MAWMGEAFCRWDHSLSAEQVDQAAEGRVARRLFQKAR